MAFRTAKEKKLIRIRNWFIFLLGLAGVLFIGYKFFGWGDKIINPTRASETPSGDTIVSNVVCDTILIEKNAYSDSLPLEVVNGQYYFTVSIDGLPLKGMLDSGCSCGIHGTLSDYNFMARHGYTKNVKFGTAVIANGDTIKIVECTVYNIKVGNMVIDSMKCSFTMSLDGPVLFGQEMLKQLGVIDYHTNKIYFK